MKNSKMKKSDVTIDANTYLMCYGADGYKHTKVKIPKSIRLHTNGELYFLNSTPSKDYGHKYPWAVEYHSGPKSNKFALYVYLDAEDGKILARVNRSDGTYVADTYDYLQRDCSDMEQKLSQIYDWFDEVLSNQKAQELDSEAEDRLYYASAKKSKMKKTGDLPCAGDVYINDYGGSCKIISVDEPSLSDEHQSDNFQVAYQMGDSYPVCHKWKDVKVMLDYNGYKYQASTKKSKVKKYDAWTVSNLFDELEEAVYDWDEGWIDNVMDANYSQAHGNVEDACKYLEDMYDECHVPRIANLCERIFAILGHSEYCASAKKSYTPDYQDFRSMVGSIRNTGNHNKVFKE